MALRYNKHNKYKRAYENAVKKITKSKYEFVEFLDYASELHKQPLDYVILLYEQGIDYKYMATYDKWIDSGRKFKSNTKGTGIPVLKYNESNSLQHLFDISQTYGKEIKPMSWDIGGRCEEELLKQYDVTSVGELSKLVLDENIEALSHKNDFEFNELEYDIALYILNKRLGNDNIDIESFKAFNNIANGITPEIMSDIGESVNSVTIRIFKSLEKDINLIRKDIDIEVSEKLNTETLDTHKEESEELNTEVLDSHKEVNAEIPITYTETPLEVNVEENQEVNEEVEKESEPFHHTNNSNSYTQINLSELEPTRINLNELEPTGTKLNELEPKEDISKEKINFKYNDTIELYANGEKSKYKNNIEAIKLLKLIESEKRYATEDEQLILAKYVGWGGLASVFDERKPNWTAEHNELKMLLNDVEYRNAKNSILTSYYTDHKIIKSIYKAIDNFGYDGENRKILDPSMGTGNFFSVLNNEMDKSELYGVELDSITGRIAKQLYQNADIKVQGFENTKFKNDTFDLIVGNVPFGDIDIKDDTLGKYKLHDYFILKSLDLAKAGGVVAVITSKGTMDKYQMDTRLEIAAKADLIGAIRLPETAFKQIAGTEVTSDILFFKKLDVERSLPEASKLDWINTEYDVKASGSYNNYFHINSDMIIGELLQKRGLYGREDISCVLDDDSALYERLDKAIEKLGTNHFTAEKTIESIENKEVLEIANDSIFVKFDNAGVYYKNYTYTVENNQLYFVEPTEDGWELKKINNTGKKAERIKGLHKIRVALRDVIDEQIQWYLNEDTLSQKQIILSNAYDEFVKKHGYINDKANVQAFKDDDQLALLMSIENEVESKGKEKVYEKADIFSKVTIARTLNKTSVDNIDEALIISQNKKQKVDIQFIANLMNIDELDTVVEQLGNRVFLNPEKYYGNKYEGFEIADEYLTGEVKHKLVYAKMKASELPELFSRNVKALKEVQPTKLLPNEISFKLGSTWIPTEYYLDFIYEKLEITGYKKSEISVTFMEEVNEYRIKGKRSYTNTLIENTYGTQRLNAFEILENSLNLKRVEVKDVQLYLDSNRNEQKRYVLNAKETMVARQKQTQLENEFKMWLFSDSVRSEVLVDIYNNKFNTIRPREYDGSNLEFTNMNVNMSLRPHQKNAVSRIINSGTALLAHVVGAGKTATMIAGAMELKSSGVANKPLFVVPNGLRDQWASEFYRFYPNANILVTRSKDFEKKNRNKFVSKIAMGNYDAVIIGHSQFEKIPMSLERREEMMRREIDGLTDSILRLKLEKTENWTIKQMTAFQNKLEMRLKEIRADYKKDNLLTFEELGVDFLFVDEAHAYKNLGIVSKMRNVAGVNTGAGSQRAMDMYMKCQYIQEINNGKGVVFATGTPISNSMAELFVMQKYLQPNRLKAMGLSSFDAWASTFGEVISQLEINPEGSGYRIRNRFAKFYNLPELMNGFKMVADIQTSDMLNLPIPELETGKPIIVLTDKTPYQNEIMDDFVFRAEQIRDNKVKPEVDNMLKLTNDAKLMSIDPRLIDEYAVNEVDSKLNIMINNVYEIYKNTSDEKLTQMIFSDSGTPKDDKFNVYDETKKVLIEQGVPSDEIAFIHDAKTDKQKEELIEKLNTGEVRIILGSTEKLGTGTNAQKLLKAVHHLDCPWKPSDIEQRDGRILRQGNTNKEVAIYRYVTKDTFDSYLWQIQEQKLTFITQVMTSKSISRSCDDVDATVLTANEVKALSTSNPKLIIKTDLERKIGELKILQDNFNKEQKQLQFNVEESYPKKIRYAKDNIEKLNSDISARDKFFNTDFYIEINGVKITERREAGEELLQKINACIKTNNLDVSIGKYQSFDITVGINRMQSYNVFLKGAGSYEVGLSESAIGMVTRIENVLSGLENKLNVVKEALDGYERNYVIAKSEMNKTFEFEKELLETQSKLQDVNLQIEQDTLGNSQSSKSKKDKEVER